MNFNADYLAETLTAKTKHYLITTIGRSYTEATSMEIYQALSHALREEIMINWLASSRTYEKEDVRTLYYLSMEYLPGRILTNNIANLKANEVVQLALQKMNRNYHDIFVEEKDPGLGNGGLGRLASCFLDSLSTLKYPAKAYGLRYQYGIFEQQIWNGVQIEAPDTWLLSENPWEFRRDNRRTTVKYCGHMSSGKNIHDDEIYFLKDFEEVSALPYDIPIIGYSNEEKFSVVPLRLWTTKESPRNFQLQRYNAGRLDQAAENITLTDVLYPSDSTEMGKRIRLKQEFLLVSASVQDIIRHYLVNHSNFRAFADKVRIQINDTHPSMVIPELIRILTKDYDIPWKMAVEMTHEITSYTNHTVLREALEQWDQGLFYYLLPRQYKILERLNLEFCNRVREKFPHDEPKIHRMSIIENGMVRMANLSIVGCHRVNGVAAIHTEILKNKVFKDFYEMNPEKFVNITNGVTQRRWLLECNPELARFITNRIGDGWIKDFSQIRQLEKFASDPKTQEEFLSIKLRNKQHLIDFLHEKNHLRNEQGEMIEISPIIDLDSLFDIQIKRMHEYKRQLMNILHIIMVYQEILEDPVASNRIKRTSIFAGKAAASYEAAKEVIELICCVARKINKDSRIQGLLKVIFVENYNVSRAEFMIPAADLSEQISTAGTEASGTGNMKLTMNGALTIGTNDGANIEMREEITDQWWPFAFGRSAEEIATMQQNQSYYPQSIYNQNERIRNALDSLTDRSFAENDREHQAFTNLFKRLMESVNGSEADHYFVLEDLQDYYETQKKVEDLYNQPHLWAEYAIHNIAGMGKFSTDYSIKRYCELIWGLKPCPINSEIYTAVENEYKEHDKCRIYVGKK